MAVKGAVLIVGFPSCVSELVCIAMLEQDHPVYLIVSQEQVSDASHLKKRFGKQLQLLVGSGDSLDFGLSGADYLQLAKTVEFVLSLHGENDENYRVDFTSLLGRELIEFSKACVSLKRVIYLSNFNFAAEFSGIVAEHDLELSNVKVQEACASFRLERILRRFHSTFPFTIIRCGTMVGESETLCPVVTLALGYPEVFDKSRDSIVLSDVNRVAQSIIAVLSLKQAPETIHVFNEIQPLSRLGVNLAQAALAQVPRSFDLRAAAKQHLREKQYDVRQFSLAQTEAQIQNTWTNDYFKAHNLLQSESELNWTPLVENEVERLTGFR